MPHGSNHRSPPEVCPVCGEHVPSKAPACPQCGADYNSGWKNEAYESVDVPDDNFDYDEFIQKEFGSSVKPYGIRPVWWITGIILLIAMLCFFLL
jgi:hypothetical protein